VPTPLYDALRVLAAQTPLRMHMPGHKGTPLPLPELAGYAALDFTELSPTGDLFAGDGPIREAEELWASCFHMPHCLFLTGGSTQGVLAALTLACPVGSTILLDRNSHRSAYHAMALLDLHPVYLYRPYWEDLPGPITPDQVDRMLQDHPEIKTVFLTSPTYYGIQSDLPALAQVIHRRGGYLVVDAAHGAHLPFLGSMDHTAADLVVFSAHKTLPAPGQSALLCAGGAFSHRQLRRAAAIYGSSSPSYPMMAALDCCRDWLEQEGHIAYHKTAYQVAQLRQDFPALTGDALDPCRLVILGDGFALRDGLEAQNVFPELADRGHVVLICTCADRQAQFDRLRRALYAILPQTGSHSQPLGPPPEPELVLSPRQAQFSPTEACVLSRAAGRISACQIAPYPPGIPVIAPGERITKKTIAYLSQIGYNMETEIQTVSFSVYRQSRFSEEG